jgi:hypothetical protein
MGTETYANALTNLRELREAQDQKKKQRRALALQKEANDLSHLARQKSMEAREMGVPEVFTVLDSDEENIIGVHLTTVKEEPVSPGSKVLSR